MKKQELRFLESRRKFRNVYENLPDRKNKKVIYATYNERRMKERDIFMAISLTVVFCGIIFCLFAYSFWLDELILNYDF